MKAVQDTLPSSSPLIFVSLLVGRGLDRGQSYIETRIYKICADENYGTFSYELLVGVERVLLIHEQRSSLGRNGNNLVQ
jgi:hypothetical protein